MFGVGQEWGSILMALVSEKGHVEGAPKSWVTDIEDGAFLHCHAFCRRNLMPSQSDFSFVAQTKHSGIPEAESSSTSWPLPAFPALSPVTLALGLCSNHVELLSVYLKPPTLSWASGAWNANLAPLISHYRPVPTNLSAKMSLTQMDLSRVTSSGSRTLNAVHKLRRKKKKKKDACSLEEKLWQT